MMLEGLRSYCETYRGFDVLPWDSRRHAHRASKRYTHASRNST